MSLWTKLTTRNVGSIDRILRAIPFAIFVYVFFAGGLSGAPLVILGVLSTMLLVTSVTGMCSIYAIFGWSTCKVKS